jgi:hypothetical protein
LYYFVICASDPEFEVAGLFIPIPYISFFCDLGIWCLTVFEMFCFVCFSVEACDKFLEQGEHKEVIRYVESSYNT